VNAKSVTVAAGVEIVIGAAVVTGWFVAFVPRTTMWCSPMTPWGRFVEKVNVPSFCAVAVPRLMGVEWSSMVTVEPGR
jgi:hypothetical protein